MNAPVQIRKPEVAERLRQRAKSEGKSITELVETMLAERIAADEARASDDRENRRAAVEAILARVSTMPRLAAWPTDDDFYDEDGLPK
jgi:hypothetical protein